MSGMVADPFVVETENPGKTIPTNRHVSQMALSAAAIPTLCQDVRRVLRPTADRPFHAARQSSLA